jgi:hypothetical protein
VNIKKYSQALFLVFRVLFLICWTILKSENKTIAMSIRGNETLKIFILKICPIKKAKMRNKYIIFDINAIV